MDSAVAFECEALRNCLDPSEPTEAILDEIRTRLERPFRNRDLLLGLLTDWREAKKAYEQAQAIGTAADHYQGGDLDDSASDEEKARPDLTCAELERRKTAWQNAIDPFQTTTEALQAQYRTPKKLQHVAEYLEHGILSKLARARADLDEFFTTTLPYYRQDWGYEVRQRRSRALALRTPGLPAWAGYWPLGQGGYGVASLWLKYNDSFSITDRIVVKDSRFEAPEKQGIWTDANLWTQGGPETGHPTEAQAMYNLRSLHGSNNVVKIKGYRIDRQLMMHRIIMEFCPFGDPHTLIKDDTIYGNAPRFAIPGNHYNTDNSETCAFIPEPFIWYVFESMVRAGLLMERGELEIGIKTWLPIVHRDMKLDNVLLGPTGGKIYPGYPEPKLADFGTCVMAPSGDPANIILRGTYGTRAPEQFHMESDEAVMPLNTKTNVWGVGMIIYSLLACENGLEGKLGNGSKDKTNLTADDFVPRLDASATRYYSGKLRELVWSCLRYNPNDRATFKSLYDDIQDYTNGKKGNLADGRRTAPTLEWEHEVRFRTTDLKWAIGTDIQQAPPPAIGGLPTQHPQGTNGTGGDPGELPGSDIPHGPDRKRKDPPTNTQQAQRGQCGYMIPAKGKGKKKVEERQCSKTGPSYDGIGYRCHLHRPRDNGQAPGAGGGGGGGDGGGGEGAPPGEEGHPPAPNTDTGTNQPPPQPNGTGGGAGTNAPTTTTQQNTTAVVYRCGVRTLKGHTCTRKVNTADGRCRSHGGRERP